MSIAVVPRAHTGGARLRASRGEPQGYGLELTQETKFFLADKGYDPLYGARPLRRAIQRYIEDPLSEQILYKNFTVGDTIIADVEGDGEDRNVVFRAVANITEPPPMELAGTTGD